MRLQGVNVAHEIADTGALAGRVVPTSKRRAWLLKTIGSMTLGSGLINLYSVLGPPLPERSAILHGIFPLEFLHISRFVTLLIGFTLVILSINVYKRKRRAFIATIVLSCMSIGFHLTKGLDYEEAAFSVVVLAALALGRDEFTVGSNIPDVRDALTKAGLGLGLTLVYGIVGFWVLDQRHFHIDFNFYQAVQSTVSLLLVSPEPYLKPATSYGKWFLESFYLITGAAITYGVAALFRPILYLYRTQPHEQALARELTARFGRTSLDFFKCWPDKSYFFSESRQSFVAYRVSGAVAIALGDSVGPADEIDSIIGGFVEFCKQNDWAPVFYQTTPEYLFAYRRAGLHKLKLGDDAIVVLEKFSLEGRDGKKLRSKVNTLEKSGVHVVTYDTPVPDDVLNQAKAVSDDWLRIPGRRERTFTLGLFKWDYLKQTPLVTVVDGTGQMLAFANVIPSYSPGETTVDLMRHRPGAPNGTMDYLFIKILLHSKAKGYKRFNMSMAPMSGFRETEQASPEERAIHYFFQHMNFIFSYTGLMHYKAKFANTWEARYIIYRHPVDLPRIALAIARVTGFPEEKAW